MTWAALIYQQYPAHLRATPGRPQGRFPVARAGKVSHMPGNVPHMPDLPLFPPPGRATGVN